MHREEARPVDEQPLLCTERPEEADPLVVAVLVVVVVASPPIDFSL